MRNGTSFIALALALVTLTGGSPLLRAGQVYQSGQEKVILLELYSSEGCSSCPRADAWFSTLLDHDDIWTRFVPVAFHVHYWDRLGWKDKLASPLYTERQHGYVRSGRVSGVYTPGMMRDGKEWRGWYRNGAASGILGHSESAGILKAEQEKPDVWNLSYYPPAQDAKKLRGHGVLLGFGIEHWIKSGENSGQTLKHDFVVLNWQRVDLLPEPDGTLQGHVRLEKNKEIDASSYAVAFWVTPAEDEFEILQAAGGPLS